MSSQTPKTSKPRNQSSSNATATTPSRSSSSSLSSNLAMIEIKQRILTSLSKLSDRDTHQIAVDDLEKIIQTLSPEGIPMLLNCLYESTNDPKPAVKKESLRLLAVLCWIHGDSTSTHLTKIIAHIVRRLKDSDSSVKDACRDAIGSLSSRYFRGEGDNGGLGSVVALFVKPLFEAMGEQNKGVQSGAAMCMGKMVECASNPPIVAFQKLCPRIYKLLNNPNFLGKAALLPVVASLSQVGALAPQSLELLLQSIHECLGSTDWATRKAAADVLSALALHSSSLITDKATSTLTVLEACRFDKIKPVRDSITEALDIWKKIAGKEDGSSDGENSEPPELSKNDPENRNSGEKVMNNSNGSSPISDSVYKTIGGSISDKAVGKLKKKAPSLTDKEPNPEFFLKLETRGSVEVVVPRRCQNSSNSHNEEESEQKGIDSRRSSRLVNYQPDDANGSLNIKYQNVDRGTAGSFSRQRDIDNFAQDKWADEKAYGKDSRMRSLDADDRMDINQRESSGLRAGISKNDGHSEGSVVNNKGNWLAIQRQLLHLERQQAYLMNMLQDFMGGSHDNMLTLENRVRGLERVVEDMARDLSISAVRRSSNFPAGFEGSSNRHISKFNGFPDYSGAKLGRGGDGRIPFEERFAPSDGIAPGTRGRAPPGRSDMSEAWDFHSYGASRNGQMGPRRAVGGGPIDVRSPKSDYESDCISSRKAWDKGSGPLRLGEGPSARSVWQASKDEATLEAIRVAGEDNGSAHTARVAIPKLVAEAMGDDNNVQERDPVWTSWSNAMDALHVGDVDSAFAEVLSTGDDMLLVKLMDRSGPVIDQLSNEIASEVLHAVGQFFLEQNLFDICLAWSQQLVDVVMESGAEVLGIPKEVKKEILLNLNEASSTLDPPEDWEGMAPDQLFLQLASAWGIDPQQFQK